MQYVKCKHNNIELNMFFQTEYDCTLIIFTANQLLSLKHFENNEKLLSDILRDCGSVFTQQEI